MGDLFVKQLTLNTALWEKAAALDGLETKYGLWLDKVGVPAAYAVARRMSCFTVDEIRAEVYAQGFDVPGRGHVFGALMRRISQRPNGFVVKMGVQEVSARKRCHARPLDLWQSLIYVEARDSRASFIKEATMVSNL